MLIKPRPQQKRVLYCYIDGTYRYFTNLTIESLIRRNIIRKRFVYSYSQNLGAAEISSYTVYGWYYYAWGNKLCKSIAFISVQLDILDSIIIIIHVAIEIYPS